MKKNIGKHRHLMTLYLRSVIKGDGGTHQNVYHPVGPLFGQIKPLQPKEVLVAMGHQLEVTHRIEIRYDNRITPLMRLSYGKRVFDICSIVNEGESDRFLTLYCKENQGAEA